MGWIPHAHREHELLWVDRGSVRVRVQSRVWRLSLGLALWIPAGMIHRVTADGPVSLGATHINPSSCARAWESPTLMTVTPAMRELLLHEAQHDMPDEHRARAQQVCIDLLTPASEHNSALIVPADDRVARLVEEVLRHPRDARSLEDWAVMLNISARTLTRIFSAETQMSFVQWRIAVRMREAVSLLMSGWGVQQVSRHLGYASVSTFVATFRRVIGVTPGVIADRSQPSLTTVSR
ncbi:hypothetical protein ASD65_03510 [Microbacterium sp. Root61]|nr:hypothetical protein ASD65_03510 [Microbacterium sp. Root61]